MKIYQPNEKKAIKECLKLLRMHTGFLKMKNYTINHYSAECECGESDSIVITKIKGNEHIQKQVILCDVCYKNNNLNTKN